MNERQLSAAEFDQQIAETRDRLPAMWWALYGGGLAQGFSEQQALELVKEFIASCNRSGN